MEEGRQGFFTGSKAAGPEFPREQTQRWFAVPADTRSADQQERRFESLRESADVFELEMILHKDKVYLSCDPML